jgi:hypothetical protein
MLFVDYKLTSVPPESLSLSDPISIYLERLLLANLKSSPNMDH